MSSHTPGPWAHSSDGVECYSEAPGKCYAVTVATIRGLDYESEFISKAMGMANARLVAAAPELLAALKAVCKAWDNREDDYFPGMMLAQDLAEAAIAKAEGRGE